MQAIGQAVLVGERTPGICLVADAKQQASKVAVNPSGILDADASGASHVHYLGNPRLESWDASRASSIERK